MAQVPYTPLYLPTPFSRPRKVGIGTSIYKQNSALSSSSSPFLICAVYSMRVPTMAVQFSILMGVGTGKHNLK